MPSTDGAEKAVPIPIEKTLFRVEEAAELLSVSRWTIYRWLEQGRLRGTKIGKSSLRIFRDSIIRLIEHNESVMPGGLSSVPRSS